MSSVQISTNQTQLEIFGIEFDLIANKNLIVAAFSQSLERRAITLPAISIQGYSLDTHTIIIIVKHYNYTAWKLIKNLNSLYTFQMNI